MCCLCLHIICSHPAHLFIHCIRKTAVQQKFLEVVHTLHKCRETMCCLCFRLIRSHPIYLKNCCSTEVLEVVHTLHKCRETMCCLCFYLIGSHLAHLKNCCSLVASIINILPLYLDICCSTVNYL